MKPAPPVTSTFTGASLANGSRTAGLAAPDQTRLRALYRPQPRVAAQMQGADEDAVRAGAKGAHSVLARQDRDRPRGGSHAPHLEPGSLAVGDERELVGLEGRLRGAVAEVDAGGRDRVHVVCLSVTDLEPDCGLDALLPEQ